MLSAGLTLRQQYYTAPDGMKPLPIKHKVISDALHSQFTLALRRSGHEPECTERP